MGQTNPFLKNKFIKKLRIYFNMSKKSKKKEPKKISAKKEKYAKFRKDKPWNITEYDKNGNINGKYLNGEWIKN